MKTWQALLVTLGIFFISLFLPPLFLVAMVVVPSAWAAIDSKEICLHSYKSGIALKPFVLFLACLLLWKVAFPCYLSVRHRIRSGLAELKSGMAGVPA